MTSRARGVLDDALNRSVTLEHSGFHLQGKWQFRELSHGLVHLVSVRTFRDLAENELRWLACGQGKRVGRFGPPLGERALSELSWSGTCQVCMGTLMNDRLERKNKDQTQQEELNRMVQGLVQKVEIDTGTPPPARGRKTDNEMRTAVQALLDAAGESDGEWVSMEARSPSALSTVYREFARPRIEAIHRKGRVYVRMVTSDD